nr:late expression factor 4 [Neodiprion sertifer nucleopolyhedrovirus]
MEHEIKYTIQCDQIRAYDIYTMLKKNVEFQLTNNYVDLRDKNNNRIRICDDGNNLENDMTIIEKKTINKHNMTRIHENWILNIVETTCEEKKSTMCADINDICKVSVFKMCGFDNVEIKCEEIYMNRSRSPYNGLHGAELVKTINLLNTLIDDNRPTQVIEKNVRIGSDEILLRIRIELEFDHNYPMNGQLSDFCEVVKCLVQICHADLFYTLHVAHDEIFNKIKYRNFEKTLLMNNVKLDTYQLYARKLDGIRCKGFTLNTSRVKDDEYEDVQILYIMCDDLTFDSIELAYPLTDQKNVCLGIQLEKLPNSVYYITDILTCFAVSYDNVTQYNLEVQKNYHLDLKYALLLLTQLRENSMIKIQQYVKDIDIFTSDDYSTSNNVNYTPTDGYIGVTTDCKLHKLKSKITYELKYIGNNTFHDNCNKKFRSLIDCDCELNNIYECTISNNIVVEIIKHRTDRYFPNTIDQ